MAIRYRKTVKICKGVRVNVSKSGLSYTLGVPGASVNVGSRGTYANVGLPGTGVSYRQRVAAPSHPAQAPAPAASPTEILVQMDDKGYVTLKYGDGRPVTDETLVRQIKRSPAFAAEKARLEQQRLSKIGEMLKDQQSESDQLLHLHRQSPKVETAAYFWKQLEAIRPEPYWPARFEKPAPSESKMRSELEIEACKRVNSIIPWRRKSLRQQYVEQQFAQRFPEAMAQWQREKKSFEEAEALHQQDEEHRRAEECEEKKAFLTRLGNGDEEATCQTIDKWLADMSLPVDMSVEYSYIPDPGKLLVDVALPDPGALPDVELVQLASGNLSRKKKTQAKLKAEYAELVFSLTVFLSANLFNLCPAVEEVVISDYSSSRNVAGDLVDDYLLSVRFPRHPFEQEQVSKTDAAEFCQRFENRLKLTASNVFKSIEPFAD